MFPDSPENIDYHPEEIDKSKDRSSLGDEISDILQTKVPDIRHDLELKKAIFDEFQFKNHEQETRLKYLKNNAVTKLTHAFIVNVRNFLLDKKLIKAVPTPNFERRYLLKWFRENKVKELSKKELKGTYTFKLNNTEKQNLINIFFDSNVE